jgi:tRNA 2-thiouridine synthesizing protein A
MTRFDKELDARGLNCPLPLLRTKKLLSQMIPGKVLKILTTDPAAEIDFRVFSELSGNELLSVEKHEKHLVFFLRKSIGHRT